MYPAEELAGITFAELGIDTGRCRSLDRCEVHCPWCHDSRQSPEGRRDREMSININAGTMTCHHCGKVTGLGKEAREHGRNPHPMLPVRRPTPITKTLSGDTFNAKPLTDTELPATLDDWAIAWHEALGLSEETVRAFNVRSAAWTDGAGVEQRAIYYPYFVDGCMVNFKKRRLPKKFTQAGGADRSLFNVDAAEGSDCIVFVEGEKDVLAITECARATGAAWVAVSTADGAPGKITQGSTVLGVAEVGSKLDATNEAKAKRVLDAASRIVVAVDNDMEGQKFRDGIIDRLGAARCWTVEWPDGCKDAGDVLATHGPEALDRCLGAARPVDLPGVASFMAEWGALESIHSGESGTEETYSTGWEELDRRYQIRLGTVTTITGIPGNGKTSLMLDVLTKAAHAHGLKAAIFSPESGTNAALFAKLVKLVADAPVLPCDNQMDKDTLRKSAEWVSNHFWRVDAARSDDDDYQVITVPELVQRLEGLVLRFGIKIAYIDPWNRLEASRPNGMTETEYVAWSINMFSRFARRHNVAVIIVCHPHKMQEAVYGKDEPIPSPYNIAGSAHWYNMSDYILGIGRAKYGDPMASPPVPKNRTTVSVMKVREEMTGDELGDTYFYYDGRSGRFYPDPLTIPPTVGRNPYATPPDLTHVHAPVAQTKAPVSVASPANDIWDDGPPVAP